MIPSTYLRLLACFGLACTLFLLLTQARSQSAKPESSLLGDHSYATIPITDGLPSFSPVKRWLVSEARYATIMLTDSLGTVFVCQGKDAQGSNNRRSL